MKKQYYPKKKEVRTVSLEYILKCTELVKIAVSVKVNGKKKKTHLVLALDSSGSVVTFLRLKDEFLVFYVVAHEGEDGRKTVSFHQVLYEWPCRHPGDTCTKTGCLYDHGEDEGKTYGTKNAWRFFMDVEIPLSMIDIHDCPGLTTDEVFNGLVAMNETLKQAEEPAPVRPAPQPVAPVKAPVPSVVPKKGSKPILVPVPKPSDDPQVLLRDLCKAIVPSEPTSYKKVVSSGSQKKSNAAIALDALMSKPQQSPTPVYSAEVMEAVRNLVLSAEESREVITKLVMYLEQNETLDEEAVQHFIEVLRLLLADWITPVVRVAELTLNIQYTQPTAQTAPPARSSTQVKAATSVDEAKKAKKAKKAKEDEKA